MSEVNRHGSGDEALVQVKPKGWPAPARDEILAQAYLRAGHTKEDQMTIFDKLFAGRPLAAQLGIGALALLVLIAAAVLLPRPGYQRALAETEGVALSYNLPANFDPQDVKAKVAQVEQSLKGKLPEGVTLESHVRIEVRREQRVVKHDGVQTDSTPQTETRTGRAVVLLTGADDATVKQVEQAVADAVPGIGAPEVHDTTWFRENGGSLDGGVEISLGLNGNQHVFNFPKDTTSDDMEKQINDWLAQNHPDMKFDVDVQISDDGSGQKQVQVKIVGKGDEEK